MEQAQACLAGDSAAYERRASGLDDVVVISALRTPMCKVSKVAASRPQLSQTARSALV